MKIVVPMAGKGSRFLDIANSNPEYKKPKPLILIKGKPMVVWAIESLPFVDLKIRPAKTKFRVKPDDLIFICRQDHQDEFKIATHLKKLFGDEIKIILLDQITRGALETVLKARNYINSDEDFIASDSDHFFDGKFLYEEILSKDNKTIGIIPVFQPPDNEVKWSYTLFDKNQRALAVGEKDPELVKKGAYANIGAYYFSSGKLFVKEAEEMIGEGEMYGAPEKQEFYVAPLYQRFINKDYKVKAAITPKVWGLGTPKDVEYFEKNFI